MKNKGFTLIELLVVIAIIGILSAVVIASLTSTRQKGVDATIKSQLTSLRNALELYFNDPTKGSNSYGPSTISCDNMFADPSISPMIDDLNKQSANNVACVTIGDKWGVSVKLKTTGFYCVDSTGINRTATLSGDPYDSLTGDGGASGFPALNTSISLCR